MFCESIGCVCAQIVLHRLSQWQKVWTIPSLCEGTVVSAIAWRPDGKGKVVKHVTIIS